jgi:hypothetical protein
VAALEDSGVVEGACRRGGGAGARAGGESWAAAEVLTAAATGGEGGGTARVNDPLNIWSIDHILCPMSEHVPHLSPEKDSNARRSLIINNS